MHAQEFGKSITCFFSQMVKYAGTCTWIILLYVAVVDNKLLLVRCIKPASVSVRINILR